MAIRPAKCVRDGNKVAWTRHSKRKPRKSYIKTMPHKELNQHRMGADKDDYDATYHLKLKDDILILRDNAIEAARQSANKVLEAAMPGNYYFLVRVYPHHVIRENKMVAGAGADRIQKGMRRAFGKPMDRAARLKKNQALFSVYVYKGKENESAVKEAFRRAKMKLSGEFSVVEE
ncbi:50S ribosomal protein L16 [Candidatus Micrarchaeota archaeon]|nr:50S ribosomal protein L16 [Candidatus Micrarchaeota archaeon]MBD3417496.1 50S ribosomal protein L16 [Candidatus Micrarchaeota archaeon]